MKRLVWVCRRRMRLLGIAALLAGCQSRPEVLEPLNEPAQLQRAPPRVSGTVPGGRSAKQVFEARGAGPEAAIRQAAAEAAPAEPGEVSLNFVDTDIREIARVILGTTLKLNYTIDPAVHGTATLDTGAPLPRSALLSTLETLLNQNGATLVRRNGLYAVVPLGNAALTNTVEAPQAPGTGTEVVALRYASAKDLAKVLEPYITEGSKLVAEPSRNALIVSGDRPARQTLIGLIRAFDIDALAGQSFAIFPTGDNDAAKLAAGLEKALRAENNGPLGDLVRIVPLPRAAAVLIASSQPRYIDAAKRLFRLTTAAEDATSRTWHVYYVRNGQSTDLENLLQRAFTPRYVTPTAPGTTAPGLETVSMGGGLGNQPGGTPRGGLTGLAGAAAASPGIAAPGGAAGAASNPAPGAAPAAEPLSSGAGPGGEAEDRIRIIANPRNNALLIYATPHEYSVIQSMLHKIDIVPLQVLIDATIAEVTLNDALSYGTQFYLGNKVAGILTTAGPVAGAVTTTGTPGTTTGPSPTVITVGGVPTTLGSNFPGFVIANGVREVLHALSAVTQVKVLSSPQVMVLDNEPARLQVGQQVPILTGTATSTLVAGAPIVNSIDYHSTGVIMQVTPRVNSGGLVTLDIAQEVSDVAPPAANTATGSPTFDDRLVKTRVAIQDGQTVALAGLIRDTAQESNGGIPFLKDVPLVGTLFSSQDNSRNRTELLVLITPHVVQDQHDARALTEDLRTQVMNAALVPQELQRKPLRGLPNPNGL